MGTFFGLTVSPNGVGGGNNPGVDNQELQERNYWGRWTTPAFLPNAASNSATSSAYARLRPGDVAFVESTSSLYVVTDRGTDGGADATWSQVSTGGSPNLENVMTVGGGSVDNDVTIAGSQSFNVRMTDVVSGAPLGAMAGFSYTPSVATSSSALTIFKSLNASGAGLSIITANTNPPMGNSPNASQSALIATGILNSAVALRSDQIQLWDTTGTPTIQILGQASSSVGGITTRDQTTGDAASIQIDTGDGGNSSSGGSAGGLAGILTLSAGDGGDGFTAATPSPAAAGGTLNINSGAGGGGQSSNVSSAQRALSGIGGTIAIVSGDGGSPVNFATDHRADGGAGGLIQITGGTGGTAFSGNATDGVAGAGGSIEITGGTAGPLSLGGGTANSGGSVTIGGGVGSDGSGGGNSGSGGLVSIVGGSGGPSAGGNTNGSGGNVNIDAGTVGTGGTGGVDGVINIGETTASAINIGGGLGAASDLTLSARGGSVALNEAGDTTLSGFTASSLVGALNELQAASGGGSLQSAYDGGQSIDTDTLDTAVSIVHTGATGTHNLLELNKSPSATQAGDAINVTLGANSTGAGVNITSSGGAGAGISVNMSGGGNDGISVTATNGNGSNLLLNRNSGGNGDILRIQDVGTNVLRVRSTSRMDIEPLHGQPINIGRQAAGAGNFVTITGDSTSGFGTGGVLVTNQPNASAAGSNIALIAGESSDNSAVNGGGIFILGGLQSNASGGNGGSVTILAGNSTNTTGFGGDLLLGPGSGSSSGSTAGENGNVFIGSSAGLSSIPCDEINIGGYNFSAGPTPDTVSIRGHGTSNASSSGGTAQLLGGLHNGSGSGGIARVQGGATFSSADFGGNAIVEGGSAGTGGTSTGGSVNISGGIGDTGGSVRIEAGEPFGNTDPANAGSVIIGNDDTNEISIGGSSWSSGTQPFSVSVSGHSTSSANGGGANLLGGQYTGTGAQEAGFVFISGGQNSSTNGGSRGGRVQIDGGDSPTGSGSAEGGDIAITAGSGAGSGGDIEINAGQGGPTTTNSSLQGDMDIGSGDAVWDETTDTYVVSDGSNTTGRIRIGGCSFSSGTTALSSPPDVQITGHSTSQASTFGGNVVITGGGNTAGGSFPLGGSVFVRGGTSTNNLAGGVALIGGNSTNDDGGNITLVAGNTASAGGTEVGGDVVIFAGTLDSAQYLDPRYSGTIEIGTSGGAVEVGGHLFNTTTTLTTAPEVHVQGQGWVFASTSVTGGTVRITGGDASGANSNGGDVRINAGQGGSSTSGSILIGDDTVRHSVNVDVTVGTGTNIPVLTLRDGYIRFTDTAATSDSNPANTGAIIRNGLYAKNTLKGWVKGFGASTIDEAFGLSSIAASGLGCVITWQQSTSSAFDNCWAGLADGTSVTTAKWLTIDNLGLNACTVRCWRWSGAAIVEENIASDDWSVIRHAKFA